MRSGGRIAVVAGVLAIAGGSSFAAISAGSSSQPARAPRAATQTTAVATATARKRRAALRERPRAFASCASLVHYAHGHFKRTRGIPDPPLLPVNEPAVFGNPQRTPATTNAPAAATPSPGSAGTSTPSYSTTNVQEPGVDEPDTAKTNGSTIFTVEQNRLFAVSVDGGTPKLDGSLDLGPTAYGAQLLLRGSRLIVIVPGAPPIEPLAVGAPAVPAQARANVRPPGASLAIPPSPYYYRATTTVDEVDVSDPTAMHVTRTMAVDGSFVDARQNGPTARLVIASPPPAIEQPRLLAQASGWIPSRHFHSLITGRRYTRAVAGCAAIARPADFSGLGTLTILTLNLDKGLWTASSDALMADAQVVYGSTKNLYVATQKWIPPQTAAGAVPAQQTTVIDQFDATNPDSTTLTATGEVPGYLLNQFSLSEFNGYLRVATTSGPIWWPAFNPQSPAPTQSQVTVLAAQGGALVPVGQVAGLGVGQKIYSVRFVDNAGYVVTFRQIDPLYTLDLSSPTAPRVAGQLELEGYSSYLHPLGGGLLLGVGQSVGANEPAGAQLELFDVSSLAAPKLLARTGLGSGSSTSVQYDHHAFLYWAPTKLAMLPLQIYPVCSAPPSPPSGGGAVITPNCGGTQSQGFTGAIGYTVDRSGISELGRVTHDPINGQSPSIERSVVIGSNVFTISYAGVMSSRLDTLARASFVAFPQPQPQPQPQTTSPPQPARAG